MTFMRRSLACNRVPAAGLANAANEGKFPSAILHPSETYLQHTSYQFDIKTD